MMTASVSGGIMLILKLPLNMLSSSLGCSARKTTNKWVFKSSELSRGWAWSCSSVVVLYFAVIHRFLEAFTSTPFSAVWTSFHMKNLIVWCKYCKKNKTKGPRPGLLAKKTNWLLKACCYTSERRRRTRCCTCADTRRLILELKGSHRQSSISLFSFLLIVQPAWVKATIYSCLSQNTQQFWGAFLHVPWPFLMGWNTGRRGRIWPQEALIRFHPSTFSGVDGCVEARISSATSRVLAASPPPSTTT